jgi:hypothetical protein
MEVLGREPIPTTKIELSVEITGTAALGTALMRSMPRGQVNAQGPGGRPTLYSPTGGRSGRCGMKNRDNVFG